MQRCVSTDVKKVNVNLHFRKRKYFQNQQKLAANAPQGLLVLVRQMHRHARSRALILSMNLYLNLPSLPKRKNVFGFRAQCWNFQARGFLVSLPMI